MLITGGTGAFGRAFTRYMLDKGHRRICIYSRDEYKQHQMREEFGTDQVRYFIGDVRDKERLKRAMRGCEYVIHAAALKRIEVGKYNPCEMVKTNVLGTMNVIEAAQEPTNTIAVKRVVYLSTDKAWQPVSAYGQSKALSESLVLAANDQVNQNGPTYVVTRYGNVANSTGSVIPVWRKAIEEGRDLRITDPNCTRFWMWMKEACDLVWKAMHDTEERLLIPELPAYRLGDLLEAMVGDLEVPPRVHLTGLPEWEKTHEGMSEGNTSDAARRMTIPELKSVLMRV